MFSKSLILFGGFLASLIIISSLNILFLGKSLFLAISSLTEAISLKIDIVFISGL